MSLQTTRRTKITKYRRYPFLNIGTLLFSIVFLYMLISIIVYFTQPHVTYYEVVNGTISGNYRFHALALHEETVVTAEQSGYIRYYAREGAKTSSGSIVCAVSDTQQTQRISSEDYAPAQQDLDRIRNLMSTFSMSYSGAAYQQTYDLKANIESILSDITKEQDENYLNVRSRSYAPESGFVIYNTDGLELETADTISDEDFDQNRYDVKNLKNRESVSQGDEIYKLITSENWKLYFPMDEDMVLSMNGMENIRFRFLKDNRDFTAPFAIITNENGTYGEISMSSSLVRYATDRFLDIELTMNKKSGLKVPSSAIVDKTFYQIPEEFAIVNESTSKEITLYVEHFRADGSAENKFITANVYSHPSGYYLVNSSLLENGDFLLVENTAKREQIDEDDLVVLHGVYNINKGYAMFREVTIIDQNKEYCIVESNNIYGLATYDYIVLNASEVDVDQIIN